MKEIKYIMLDAQFLTDLIANMACDEAGDAIMEQRHLDVPPDEMVTYTFTPANFWRAFLAGVPFELVSETPLIEVDPDDEYEPNFTEGEPLVLRFCARLRFYEFPALPLFWAACRSKVGNYTLIS